MILDYIKKIDPVKFSPSHGMDCLTPEPVLTLVDYLRITNPDTHKFESFFRKFIPYLKGVGFDFVEVDKKINGYQKSWLISVFDTNVGYLCADERMGGMIDVTGRGCQLLQNNWALWCCFVSGIQEFDMRIKRVDIAADFKGSMWDDYGMNIVGISDLVSDGKFFSSTRAGGVKPSVNTFGDWLSVRGKNASSYDPKVDCPDGLTINIGSKGSTKQWCIYEKGKQLAGVSASSIYDGSLNSWVRVERRLMSGSGRSAVEINCLSLVYPDEAFTLDCSGVRDFVDDWYDFKSDNGVVEVPVPEVGLSFDRVGLTMGVCVKKTAIHVANQCGRFFKTLEDIGVDIVDFANIVRREEGLKGFDPSVYTQYLGAGLNGVSGASSAASELLGYLRSEYGSGSDPAQLNMGLFDVGGVV